MGTALPNTPQGQTFIIHFLRLQIVYALAYVYCSVMAFTDLFVFLLLVHPLLSFISILFVVILFCSIYRLRFHPLSSVPGPWYCAILPLFQFYCAYTGRECTVKRRLHSIYGPILRTGPNDVDISDGAALAPIYSEKGGFRKAPCYTNFDIDGHASIFSELEPAKRAVRSKAVMPIFSAGAIRSGQSHIAQCVDRFVERLKVVKRQSIGLGIPVDLLNLTRSLAADTITSYLFDETYGGLTEAGKFSATGMVDTFVAVGRFFYLPTWLFQSLTWVTEHVAPSVDGESSIRRVDSFVAGFLSRSEAKDKSTYQARLRAADLAPSEVHAQCKDLMFAGIDSTGMNLATILWNLAKAPRIRHRLTQEILENSHVQDPIDVQSLPYLRGVIREGLRLSLANPSRFPRLAPPGGWTFNGYYFPAGTVVACAPSELHLNPSVFSNPSEFMPERWDGPSAEMLRDHIPFGLGSRQCIARNLASAELFAAVKRCVEERVLDGATALGQIEIIEWFNSKVQGGKIEVMWKQQAEQQEAELDDQ